MVLEPLSAFAVACNILQVVDNGTKLFSKAIGYRTASDGALAEHNELRNTSSALERLNEQLQSHLLDKIPSAHGNTAVVGLVEANKQCLRLSKAFRDTLDSLIVRNPHAWLETIRKSVKSIRYKDKINAMEKQLSQARDNLNLSLLIYMNSRETRKYEPSSSSSRSSQFEESILQAITTSSTPIHDEVRELTQRLQGVDLESMQPVLSDFVEEHRRFLLDLAVKLDSICGTIDLAKAQKDTGNAMAAHHRLVESLHFPQIDDRKYQIAVAYKETYRWILEPSASPHVRWDNLAVWLNDPDPPSRIYWISSKPGAGKSSVVRYLEEQLSTFEDVSPQIENNPALVLSYYFWSPGISLQRSIVGFSRTMLCQIFERLPDVSREWLPTRIWRMACDSRPNIQWSQHELWHCLKNVCSDLASRFGVVFLIDGLDEVDGDDEVRVELTRLLHELAEFQNVKLCISSRRWTVFQDAFGRCPQMRLEDLNHRDIDAYVRSQLLSQDRYLRAFGPNTVDAEDLITKIVEKAEGVFLWVRLVVRELRLGLRDGDSVYALRRKLQHIPNELTEYFRTLIESVEVDYRQEASLLLQIALYREQFFITLHNLRLVDLMFLEDAYRDFGLLQNSRRYKDTFTSAESTYQSLDAALRRLSSRCKGLLECYHHPGSCEFTDGFDLDGESTETAEILTTMQSIDGLVTVFHNTLIPVLRKHRYTAYDFHIDFMHRSLRDYLLEEASQRLLHSYTGGPVDARNYLRNARLMLIRMNKEAAFEPETSVGLASFVLSTLSISEFRNEPRCLEFTTEFRHVLDYVQEGNTNCAGQWYICRSFEAWQIEQSNFLSLAIDFGLTVYLQETITQADVRAKTGRPLLDHVLRPRFAHYFDFEVAIGNPYPDPALLQLLLSHGANPNQEYNGVSIWALFLSFTAYTTVLWQGDANAVSALLLSLRFMIEYGADLLIPSSALDVPAGRGLIFCFRETFLGSMFDAWPTLTQASRLVDGVAMIAVWDILDFFIPCFGVQVDTLRALVRMRSAFRSGPHGTVTRFSVQSMASSSS